LRKYMLICIAACFYYSGLVSLARLWKRKGSLDGQCLIILNYHCATGGDLHSHLLYLRRHYRLLHLEAALEELYTPRKDKPFRRARRTGLVITFDDGYRDNYSHGYALARDLQIPITIFLIPYYLESGDYFWWREHKRLLLRTEVKEVTVDGHSYHLEQPEERHALSKAIDTHLRYANSVAQRESFLGSIRKELAIPASVDPEEEPALPLTWAEVQEMEKSGWVSFGAHTQHHPILAYLADPAEVQYEVEECRTQLEQHLGHPVHTFAYPIGQIQHIGEEVLQAVKHAGYKWAFTTQYGFNTPRSEPFLLRRIEVDVSQHWLIMAAEAAGIWGLFSRLRWVPFIRKHFTNATS
jgi:peptidoglycan/xylan/chitin deacetylase (PgdA/CDA1 family)